MKVTIIVNGTNQIVLKPETPLENLVVKTLTDRPLISKHHESTQILGESSPNCLVITPSAENQPLTPENQLVLAVINCHSQNEIVGILPLHTPTEEILYFIKQELGFSKVEMKDTKAKILYGESFNTVCTGTNPEVIEFAVMKVTSFTKW